MSFYNSHPQQFGLRRYFFFCLLLALFGVLLLLPPAEAETTAAGPWHLSADRLERDTKTGAVYAFGQVVIRQYDADTQAQQIVASPGDAVVIRADRAEYDPEAGEVRAEGHLQVQFEGDQLQAEKGVIKLADKTGIFYQATVIGGEKELYVEGRVIEKTGPTTYRLEDGWLVTCRIEPGETPPWRIAAKEVEITHGGYGFLHHASLQVQGVPILYSPIMVVPVKDTRQSGLLIPRFSFSSRDGFGLELPFFWNFSPSADFTFYPQYLANRGTGLGVSYRYRLSQRDQGLWMGSYLSDQLSDPGAVEYYTDTGYTHTNSERYWLRGKADQDLAAWQTRLDVDWVSDRDYLQEFKSGLIGYDAAVSQYRRWFGRDFQDRGIDQRRSHFKALRSWENQSLEAEFLAINDVSAVKPTTSAVWHLPALAWKGVEPLGLGVELSWDADYGYHWRQEGVAGHRLDLFPVLSTGLPVGKYLEGTVSLGLRSTTYYGLEAQGDGVWQGESQADRLLGELKTEIGTTLRRDFGWQNQTGGEQLSHLVRPFIGYQYIPEVDQTDLPAFDGVDAIAAKSLVTYGTDHFFSLSGTRSGTAFSHEYASLTLQQSYDLRPETKAEPFRPIEAELGYQPLSHLQLSLEGDFDVYGEGMVMYGAELGYHSRNSQDQLALSYRYRRAQTTSILRASGRLDLSTNFHLTFLLDHSFEEKKTLERNLALVYEAPCWSMELASQYAGEDHKFLLLINLTNLGSPLNLGI